MRCPSDWMVSARRWRGGTHRRYTQEEPAGSARRRSPLVKVRQVPHVEAFLMELGRLCVGEVHQAGKAPHCGFNRYPPSDTVGPKDHMGGA
jgi:hypothetical protein